MAKPQVRNRETSSQRIWLFALALIALTALAYWPAWNGKPIWDDNSHITQPELRSWHGLVEIWTQVGATQQYYPLVHSIFWIEQRLWGDSVLGYHLVNILLHALGRLWGWHQQGGAGDEMLNESLGLLHFASGADCQFR